MVQQYKSNPARLNSTEGMCDYLLTENLFQLLDYDLDERKDVCSQCKHTTLPLCFTPFILLHKCSFLLPYVGTMTTMYTIANTILLAFRGL